MTDPKYSRCKEHPCNPLPCFACESVKQLQPIITPTHFDGLRDFGMPDGTVQRRVVPLLTGHPAVDAQHEATVAITQLGISRAWNEGATYAALMYNKQRDEESDLLGKTPDVRIARGYLKNLTRLMAALNDMANQSGVLNGLPRKDLQEAYDDVKGFMQ